jgi:hypothetical protein
MSRKFPAPGQRLTLFMLLCLVVILLSNLWIGYQEDREDHGMLRASDSGQSTRIPELTAAIRVTFMRILMGGASAVMIYVFLRSSLSRSLFSQEIAQAVETPWPYTAYAVAFVPGFSERLVLRAVETVAGKADDSPKASGTS